MVNRSWQGKTALITGASSGIGATLARKLAQGGCHLVLTARRVERLEALAQELRQYNIQVDVIPCDLSRPGAPRQLIGQIGARGRAIDFLVNNAGFGMSGEFADGDADAISRMLQVNVIALVELTHAVLPSMRRRGSGDILLVASMAGFMSLPLLGLYAASKALVLHFGEALAYELRPSGIRVTILCPGPTSTEFMEVSSLVPSRAARALLMPVDRVADDALKAMKRGRRVMIPGCLFRMTVWLMELLPRGLALRLAAFGMRRAAL